VVRKPNRAIPGIADRLSDRAIELIPEVRWAGAIRAGTQLVGEDHVATVGEGNPGKPLSPSGVTE
jgi:hypothetical protein